MTFDEIIGEAFEATCKDLQHEMMLAPKCVLKDKLKRAIKIYKERLLDKGQTV